MSGILINVLIPSGLLHPLDHFAMLILIHRHHGSGRLPMFPPVLLDDFDYLTMERRLSKRLISPKEGAFAPYNIR